MDLLSKNMQSDLQKLFASQNNEDKSLPSFSLSLFLFST